MLSLAFLGFLTIGTIFSTSSSLIITFVFYIYVLVIGYFQLGQLFTSKWIKKISFLLGLFCFGIYFYEALKYDNYIYSRLHIIPDHLGVFIGFLIGLLYLSVKIQKSFLIYICLLITIAYGFAGASQALGKSAAGLAYWSHLPSGNAERSTQKIYGQDLKFIDFIRRKIPKSARIIIPPAASGRRHTADLWIMSSLLYPRQIIQFTDTAQILPTDYILISSESDNRQRSSTWPDFDLSDTKIIIYDWQTDSARQLPDMDYSLRTIPVTDPWGFITFKHQK